MQQQWPPMGREPPGFCLPCRVTVAKVKTGTQVLPTWRVALRARGDEMELLRTGGSRRGSVWPRRSRVV